MKIKVNARYDNEILDVKITPLNPDGISGDDYDFRSLCFDFVDELRRSGIRCLSSSYRRDPKCRKFEFSAYCTPREKELILRRLEEISLRG